MSKKIRINKVNMKIRLKEKIIRNNLTIRKVKWMDGVINLQRKMKEREDGVMKIKIKIE